MNSLIIVGTLLALLIIYIIVDYIRNVLPEHRSLYWTDETPEQMEWRAERMRCNIRKNSKL